MDAVGIIRQLATEYADEVAMNGNRRSIFITDTYTFILGDHGKRIERLKEVIYPKELKTEFNDLEFMKRMYFEQQELYKQTIKLLKEKRERDLILQKQQLLQELEEVRSKKQNLIQELKENDLDLPFLKSKQESREDKKDFFNNMKLDELVSYCYKQIDKSKELSKKIKEIDKRLELDDLSIAKTSTYEEKMEIYSEKARNILKTFPSITFESLKDNFLHVFDSKNFSRFSQKLNQIYHKFKRELVSEVILLDD